MTGWSVRRHADAPGFLERARPWLLRAEAENNLILGIAGRLVADPGADAWFVTVERDDEVVGCAFLTPPLKLGVTRMPDAALPAVVDVVREVWPDLPGVLGPEPTARNFALTWHASTGTPFTPGMRQRIYQLTRVTPPARVPAGALRTAKPQDVPLLLAWSDAFFTEARIEARDSRTTVAEWMARGALFVWDVEGEPRCMAGRSADTPNGARIGYVYTPPAHRRRGYASACTAAVSQLLLDSGKRLCFLYTDLSNPASNRLYQDIGYEPVGDAADYWLA